MDVPDNTSTALSSPDSPVSSVAGTLGSVSLLHTEKAPKSITDIPSEMVLRIYSYLDSPSEVIALNSTSRLYYWIWRMNAASTSSAVLSRSVECYNNALELFEVEERVKQIHCIVHSRSGNQKRVRIAQREARDVVQQARQKGRLHHISGDVLYHGVLYRNGRLLSMARDASHVLDLIESRVTYKGGTAFDNFDSQFTPSGPNVIIAYHELAILRRLKTLEAMDDRLKTMCKRKIRQMLYVATYLLCYCPDKDKVRLDISRAMTLRANPWGLETDNWDLELRPCNLSVSARRAFYSVADWLGEPRIPEYMFENRSGCHGDCDGAERMGEW